MTHHLGGVVQTPMSLLRISPPTTLAFCTCYSISACPLNRGFEFTMSYIMST